MIAVVTFGNDADNVNLIHDLDANDWSPIPKSSNDKSTK